MNCTRDDLLLYAVTDSSWTYDRRLYDQVEEALKGGATFIQLREKGMEHDEYLKEAIEIKELCKKYNVPFVINDRVDIAIECDADGVHVGQKDMEAGEVRAKLGPDKIIGVSARTVEQALLAQKHGADYLGVGAVFSTSTKEDAKALDHKVLKDICEAVDIPAIAIGGISAENVSLSPFGGSTPILKRYLSARSSHTFIESNIVPSKSKIAPFIIFLPSL